jgi:hypothetical protein
MREFKICYHVFRQRLDSKVHHIKQRLGKRTATRSTMMITVCYGLSKRTPLLPHSFTHLVSELDAERGVSRPEAPPLLNRPVDQLPISDCAATSVGVPPYSPFIADTAVEAEGTSRAVFSWEVISTFYCVARSTGCTSHPFRMLTL